MKQTSVLVDTVRILREEGALTNRTHIHKLLFFAKHRYPRQVPFRFVLHYYGPYSFELDRRIRWATAIGALASEPSPAGMKYCPGPDERAPGGRASPALRRYLTQLARQYGRMGVAELEKLATALWLVQKRVPAEKVPEALARLKPHVPAEEAADAWLRLQQSGLIRERRPRGVRGA